MTSRPHERLFEEDREALFEAERPTALTLRARA